MRHDCIETTLKSAEKAEIIRIVGPDPEWSERIRPLLAHKGDPWNWQIAQTLQNETGNLIASYYIALVRGEIAANVATFECEGVGVLGHVFTVPAHRRKGLCSTILATLMDDFATRTGRALFLQTGFDSPAWHIYRTFGFESIRRPSGFMAYHDTSESEFEKLYFEAAPTNVRAIEWCDWPKSCALTLQKAGSSLRLPGLGVYGRSSMEHPFLMLYRDVLRQGQTKAAVIESESTGAVVGIASRMPDRRFPGTAIVDSFVHPNFSAESTRLLESLGRDGDFGKEQAYADSKDAVKIESLEAAGFRFEATLSRQIRLGPGFGPGFADVAVFSR